MATELVSPIHVRVRERMNESEQHIYAHLVIHNMTNMLCEE